MHRADRKAERPKAKTQRGKDAKLCSTGFASFFGTVYVPPWGTTNDENVLLLRADRHIRRDH